MAIDNAAEIRTIGVVGAGAMGRGIAQVAATGGYAVRLMDAKPGVADAARTFVGDLLTRAVDKGRMTKDEADGAMQRLTPVESLGALADCDLVIEAVVEKLDVKQAVFAELEDVVGDDCILASNTSSLSITAIAAGSRRPERFAGMHFFNPVPLMKLVEVIDGLLTGPTVGERLVEVGRRMGREPVRVGDAPGFLVNQIGRGYTIEAAHIADEKIADFAAIDRIMRDLVGFRMGPFELMDLTGLDVTHPATELIHDQFYFEPRYRPSLLMAQRATAGVLGRKSGGGFYAYADGKPVTIAEAAPAGTADRPIWVSRADACLGGGLAKALAAGGARLDEAARPGSDAVCVVTPIGQDATSAALAEGLDPARTVAVDGLFGFDRRRVVMPTAATAPEVMSQARLALAAGGVPVTVIRESPGFVAQRIVAMIVNICAAIAQSQAAAPDDIDKAPQLALNYPAGPLSLGDRIGADRILRVLESLQAAYGDPRYRPSPWLSRRARLGLSLTAPDPSLT
ncbi:3-hydroxyacyl-CoA dehydrogenase [Pararhizobium haloflavum]|uniref:3-hydroxyacyl-CoA dehydrogenase n=1 Tax=Pararhizobium haloflavum TaxID=2037914 RepID=UPI001FE2304E|nr:3-hydroxyacyl-CoA dehydrogenase [Pararhizobium haloflavum]